MSQATNDSRAGWARRFPAALRDDYLGVDEHRVEDLLAMVAQLAGSIEFRDLANRPAGNWNRFARSDELFVIGRLLAVNLGRQKERFRLQLAALEEAGRGTDPWWRILGELPSIRLARLLDEIHGDLRRLPSLAAVRAREKIENVIAKSLAVEIGNLRRACEALDAVRAAEVFTPLRGVWDKDSGGAVAVLGNDLLRDGFNAIFTAVQHLQGSLRGEFEHSLARQDHDPSVALLVAFFQLRQEVQKRINRFPARHIDLYYDQVLRVAPRPLEPDRTVLLLSVDGGGRVVDVPAGTMFSGGVDANREERRYRSLADLSVSDARVVEMHSLWFERSAGISPENALRQHGPAEEGQCQYATSARLLELADGEPEAADIGVANSRAYSLFGHREANRAASRGRYADIGIAVASPALAMQQGSREILVTFTFAARTGEPDIDSFVGELARILDTTKADAFFKAFRNAFRISVTEESGWYFFPEYLPTSPCVDPSAEPGNTLGISLRLPPDVGAIVPARPAIHGEGFPAASPVIRFTLDEAYLYPYSLFADLTLLSVGVDVKVGGCRDVQAYNQLGRLSASSQFFPFGPTPLVGDYLIIGCEEAAGKTLTFLELDITWAGVPTEARGFADHYRQYPTEYDNASFKVRLAALADRHWLPSNESERIETELFETRGSTAARGVGAVARRRLIDLSHLCKTFRQEVGSRTAPFAYDVSTRSGFVKLGLSAPDSGFGHRQYPSALSQVVAKNSAKPSRLPLVDRLRKAVPPEPLPAVPYTPVIDHLLINYGAHDEIDLRYAGDADAGAAESVFHIHPTGIEPLRAGRPDGVRMVPWYREDGHLLIGIAASALGGPLSLFFHLKDDSRPMHEYRESRFHWYYLAEDQWVTLGPERILSDGTYGFLRSGIVALDLPADATADNRVCRPGLYWLRVSASWDDTCNVSSLFSVHANAMEVVWQPGVQSAADHLDAGLKAGTIRQSMANLVGIADIRQPIDSWGGRQAESRSERIVRVNERLRHKGRAVTAGDYEALVLHEFPDLHQVKCFPCCAGDAEAATAVSPGDTLVVVVPRLEDGGRDASGPMVDAHQLREITRFISALNPGIARVRVRNPSYEQIQVRCKVRLKSGQNSGNAVAAINRSLRAFLSPWSHHAKLPAFDWRIRCIDLQAHLQGLHSVTLATGVSVLRISTDEKGRKRLSDTARENGEQVLPRLPWSVAVPFGQHFIEVVEDIRPRQPSVAGYGNLAIGSTFIGTREGDD